MLDRLPGAGGDGDADGAVDVDRRRLLAGTAGAAAGIGGFRAVDNVLLGFGDVVGTNLVEQDLAPIVRRRFAPSPFEASVDGTPIRYADGRIAVGPADAPTTTLSVATASPGAAATVDARHGLDGATERLVRDLGAVDRGDVAFTFHGVDGFFDRLDGADTRPLTVGALRGHRFDGVEPTAVRELAGVDPAEPAALVEGLAAGFRRETRYDVPRYVAGSVEDNLLMGAGDLRGPLEAPTAFDAILGEGTTGMFCYDFAYRAIEAFHAAPPREQSPPVMGAVVTDARHKHVYTGLASVVRRHGAREGSGGAALEIPMTFVDYTHSTLYDDLGLRGVLGEGVEAYGDRHRTTGVYWNRYARW